MRIRSGANGDDKADTRIRKLVGFDSADSHHGIAAFEWGPGGGLYFQEGTFKFSQVESPYGSGEFIRSLEASFGHDHENLILSEIEDKHGIYDSIKTFLGRGK